MSRVLRLNYLCDGCGLELPPRVDSWGGDVSYSPPDGWEKVGNKIYCPECQERIILKVLNKSEEDAKIVLLRNQTYNNIRNLLPSLDDKTVKSFVDILSYDELLDLKIGLSGKDCENE